MPKKSRKRASPKELKLSEDPFLLDDPGGSALEWLEPGFRDAVRRCAGGDPWEEGKGRAEADAITERRRRKLQDLSVSIEEKKDDSAA